MSGVVEGGWEFVVAAYVLTAVILTSYSTSVFWRFRKEKDRIAREAGSGTTDR